MLIAALDLETTGLEVATCHIVELSYVVVRANTTRPIYASSCLLYDEGKMGREPIPPEVTAINGISNEVLRAHSAPLAKGLEMADSILKHFGVEHIVAHNAEGFDRPILERHNPAFKAYKWVDSRADIEWPGTCHKLNHLAAEHGFVNPFPHTGLSDVLTMLRLLSLHDFKTVAERAALPWITLEAQVSYDDREKARARRYNWYPAEKRWRKKVKADRVEQEKAEAPFPVQVVV